MSNNPQNYVGSTVSVVGYAAGPYEVKKVGSSELAELSIAVGKGYKNRQTNEWVDQGTDWYTLQATADYASDNWPEVGKGDKVRVDNARLEARPFDRKDGSHDKALVLKYGDLRVIQAKNADGDGEWPED